MGFALEKDEPFSSAVTRIAVEQIDLALNNISAPSQNLSKSIHATRQCLKRIRALLALARDELGDKVFAHEWACYRNAGRLLAGGRDAAVAVETFDALVSRFSEELPEEPFLRERSFLVDRRDARLNAMVEHEAALTKVSGMLVSARERVPNWPIKSAGFKAIRKGVRRSYRAGREDLRTVVRDPTPTNFHAWRRPVKVLWHQLQILTPIWPVVLHAHAEELHALSDRLNANHDLDVLRHTGIWSQVEVPPGERAALFSLIDRRCREIETLALPLGERFYTERPSRFIERLESYWKTWRHRGREGETVSDSGRGLAASTGT
ncbi:MAG TPA: CHAD domain-containing protein [Blastocatellia bacterium]|nr:CHAD domain-containing protein [Blastocatellia bacterium]